MKPVIIGSGLAGLTVALSLAPMPVVVLSAKKLGQESSSVWAQGGIAAAVGGDDTPALHAADTIAAGVGLCDAAMVRQVTRDGPDVIERLLARGVAFDRDKQGYLSLSLEGAHSRRRVVHVAGDGTGAGVMKALVALVKATPSIEVIEDAVAVDLLADDRVRDVVFERNGARIVLPADRVVMASGGAGALWLHTTNPLSSWGRGLALAARAGAVLGDLEFMQFHPTAIDVGLDPMPLASEALRGEGAMLVDEKGERFVKELLSRDVVSNAIWKHTSSGHPVFLDARTIADFAHRFPSVNALCLAGGIDPQRQPIPIRPAAHYHIGGIVTDANGRSSVKGLWACGEVASTGLHGANRLASNSLLEAASLGRAVAQDIVGVESSAAAPVKDHRRNVSNDSVDMVRGIVSKNLGVLRDAAGIKQAIDQLRPLAATSDMALVGLMIAHAALQREETRGSQRRVDFPATSKQWERRQTIALKDVLSP